MTRQEIVLYNQIHPANLITDWVTVLIALYLF
jgi:hypothetical protein